MNYYNENDPKAAAWLRELRNKSVIPDGIIDERSIHDVKPEDLHGFAQCHFFAGIGGWPEALRLAGWPETRPVWTGSCPCQPFSTAGRQLGTADPRHLWPEFFRLISECQPPTIFGEQVASKAGRLWLAGIRADVEAMGYGVGAADLCAASVGAPHIRQRLFWMVHPVEPGLEGHGGDGDDGDKPGRDNPQPDRSITQTSFACWSDYQWLSCLDGKTRRTQSGLFPLAHGVPGRVGLLRGYGNAIVPLLAAEFIQAAELALHDFGINQLS